MKRDETTILMITVAVAALSLLWIPSLRAQQASSSAAVQEAPAIPPDQIPQISGLRSTRPAGPRKTAPSTQGGVPIRCWHSSESNPE